jgi:tryptophan halogenase
MFPAASYQYVYYGMRGTTLARHSAKVPTQPRLDPAIRQRARALVAAMPTNRTYLDAAHAAASSADRSQYA